MIIGDKYRIGLVLFGKQIPRGLLGLLVMEITLRSVKKCHIMCRQTAHKSCLSITFGRGPFPSGDMRDPLVPSPDQKFGQFIATAKII